jgi:hypothetical protein
MRVSTRIWNYSFTALPSTPHSRAMLAKFVNSPWEKAMASKNLEKASVLPLLGERKGVGGWEEGRPTRGFVPRGE